MDIQPNSGQAISDDQELAKVLAGVSQQTEDQAVDAAVAAPPVPEPVTPPSPMPDAGQVTAAPIADEFTGPVSAAPMVHATGPVDPALDGIKQDAINELRPLVDKLQVSAEEKFDTYLLLLRSTDDKDLIAPAHEAAKSIQDETKRAQALLDIIKEIDFFSGNQQQPQE